MTVLGYSVEKLAIDRWPNGYEARFGNPLSLDYGLVLWTLQRVGFLRKDQIGFGLTERGAIWGHRIPSLFSLNGIDAVWTDCKREAWPRSVALA